MSYHYDHIIMIHGRYDPDSPPLPPAIDGMQDYNAVREYSCVTVMRCLLTTPWESLRPVPGLSGMYAGRFNKMEAADVAAALFSLPWTEDAAPQLLSKGEYGTGYEFFHPHAPTANFADEMKCVARHVTTARLAEMMAVPDAKVRQWVITNVVPRVDLKLADERGKEFR